MTKPMRPSIELRADELLEAIAELGLIDPACRAVGYNRQSLYKQMDRNPELCAAVRHAQAIGREKRQDYLESLAYSMAEENPTMVMFLLKKLDPSYRESYHVSTSTQITDFTIDLGAVNRALDVTSASTEDISVES